MRRQALIAAAVLALGAEAATGHDGLEHNSAPEVVAHQAEAGAALPFPVEIQPRFDLLDQTGRRMTEADLAGRPALMFFGYASCEAICSVALPTMAETLEQLGPDAGRVTVLMITVDPVRDTPEALAAALARHDRRLIGLTGSAEALAAARAAFQIETRAVAGTPKAPVYAHGSFIYVVAMDGRVVSVLPPITPPEKITAALRRAL